MSKFAFYALTFMGLLSPAAAELLRVPVQRVESQADALEAFLTASAAAADFDLRSAATAAGPADVSLHNRQNLGYSATISVGTPVQNLTVAFSTGVSHLWVPGKTAAGSKHAHYDHAASSTGAVSGGPFTTDFGTGNVSGELVEDRVQIGDVLLENFTLAEITDSSGLPEYEDWGFDGVLGLGLAAPAVDYAPAVRAIAQRLRGAPTALQALGKAGQWDEPVFGFYLGDKAPGQLVLGGVAPEHYVGEFNWIPVTRGDTWQIQLDSVSHGDSLRIHGDVPAILNPVTPMLIGPAFEVESIASMMGAVKCKGFYVVECNATAPGLTFTLAGQEYTLSQQELVLKQVGKYCVLSLYGGESPFSDQQIWILGDVFMRKYYVQFDWGKKRVGVARAASAASTPPPNLI